MNAPARRCPSLPTRSSPGRREVSDISGSISQRSTMRSPTAMWIAIAEAMESFRNDGDVRVVVMSGEGGRAFSAGADISEFSENRSTEAQIEVYDAAGRAAYDAITNFPKPVIARIEGYCVGGGLAVALCADIRIGNRQFEVRHSRREAWPRVLTQGPAPARRPRRADLCEGNPVHRQAFSPPPRRSGWGS